MSRDQQSSFVSASQSTVGLATPDQQRHTAVHDQRNPPDAVRKLCELHAKRKVLYCFDCSKGICGDCIGEGHGHDLHHIENLTIVHRKTVSEFEVMLTEAEQKNNGLRTAAVLHGKTLEVLENEEAAMLKQIEAIAASSKSEVTRLTSDRKTALKKKIQLPEDTDKALVELRKTIQQYSAEDFMDIWTNLGQILPRMHPDRKATNAGNVALEKEDQLQCDLVPAYQFAEIVLAGFFAAANRYDNTTSINSPYDVVWKITVTKLHIVQLQAIPTDAEIFRYPHKLTVIIHHANMPEDVRKTFDVDGTNNTFAVAQTRDLEKFSRNGNLEIKVGIRPLDALVEKRLLSYRYEQLKAYKATIERQLESRCIECQYNCSAPKTFDIRANSLNSRSWWAGQIKDEFGRLWYLRFHTPGIQNRLQVSEGHIDVWIDLGEGSATNCKFFVELKNMTTGVTIFKSKTCYFTPSAKSNGWTNFTTWGALSDSVRDPSPPDGPVYGLVSYRFGIKPVPN